METLVKTSRRTFLSRSAQVITAGALGTSIPAAGLAQDDVLAGKRKNPLPRWRGFNLLKVNSFSIRRLAHRTSMKGMYFHETPHHRLPCVTRTFVCNSRPTRRRFNN